MNLGGKCWGVSSPWRIEYIVRVVSAGLLFSKTLFNDFFVIMLFFV